MSRKVEQWMRDAAKEYLETTNQDSEDALAKIIASHAPSAAAMSPKDEEIIDWLVKEKAFNPKAALKCLTTFKETMQFAGIDWPSEDSCVVCGALLLPPSEPLHCEDCHLTDEHRLASEAAAQPTPKRYWCCSAEFGKHEPHCHNYKPWIEHNDH